VFLSPLFLRNAVECLTRALENHDQAFLPAGKNEACFKLKRVHVTLLFCSSRAREQHLTDPLDRDGGGCWLADSSDAARWSAATHEVEAIAQLSHAAVSVDDTTGAGASANVGAGYGSGGSAGAGASASVGAGYSSGGSAGAGASAGDGANVGAPRVDQDGDEAMDDAPALAVLRREIAELLRAGDGGVLAVAARLRAARRGAGSATVPPPCPRGGLGVASAAANGRDVYHSAQHPSSAGASASVGGDSSHTSSLAADGASSVPCTGMSRQPSRCSLCLCGIDAKATPVVLEWPSAVDDKVDWLAFTTTAAENADAATADAGTHHHHHHGEGPPVQCAACADVGCAL
jgi:hypothetical protein